MRNCQAQIFTAEHFRNTSDLFGITKCVSKKPALRLQLITSSVVLGAVCDPVFISEIYGFRRKSAANMKNHGKSR